MRVLVTGGAGFIGSNLVARLVRDGHEVVVLDDLSTGLRENLAGLDVDFRLGNLVDPTDLASAASGVDAIVHLGARGSVPRSIQDPLATHEVNATGTLHVLEQARKTNAHLIVASSSSVYGANESLPKREKMWFQPLSPYGASKLAAEAYSMAYKEVYGLDVLVTRFFNVYGPKQRPDHDYAAVIPKFAAAAMRGTTIEVHGNGLQSRDFTYVDSVTQLLSSAVERRLVHDTPVNVAFGIPNTVLEVVEEMEKALGAPITRRHIDARVGDVAHSQNDPALMRALFPEVLPTPIATGVRKTVDWLRSAVES